jgi:uncharacterized membrane protein YgdD (TMEM256/DUF423 family)
MSSAWLHRSGNLTIGSLSCASAIVAGAFGSHGLSSAPTSTSDSSPAPLVGDKEKKGWESANRYQWLHSLAIISLPAILPAGSLAFNVASPALILGTAAFTGSIYSKVLLLRSADREHDPQSEEGKAGINRKIQAAGMVGKGAPIGGLLMMAGWISLTT